MAGEGRFSHLIVISLGGVCIQLYLLQQEARSGYAPETYCKMRDSAENNGRSKSYTVHSWGGAVKREVSFVCYLRTISEIW